jgi:hypothetical protein
MSHESTHQLIRSHLEMSTCILQIDSEKGEKQQGFGLGLVLQYFYQW